MIIFVKKLINILFTGNFFIAICAAGMILTTQLLNGIHPVISPYLVFLVSSTFILYNFHRISFKLDFSGKELFFQSLRKIVFKPFETFFYILALIVMSISFFFLKPLVLLFLIPLSLCAFAYSIPFINLRKRRVKLRELLFIKTPVLAMVWGLSTTLIPLIQQNKSLSSSFVWMQVICSCLFVFALCVPFEIRDIEADSVKNIRTFPVIYGTGKAKLTGIIIVVLEIIFHHWMPLENQLTIAMLDISSLVALLWIVIQNKKRGIYFYKFLVDGTMLLRFLLLFIVV